MKIAYFVHDLNDPAVHRRVRMLQAGGATVELLGFCRGPVPARVEGCSPVLLARTHDARLLQRAAVTALAACRLRRLRNAVAGADAVVARQLEMLVIAGRARRRHAPRATLTYECLDIHRLMVGSGAIGRVMRAIEGTLLRTCDLLVVSSEGFVREYFARRYRSLPRVLLCENKVLSQETAGTRGAPRAAGAPWRIGWFGNIRCRRSLVVLAGLTRRFPGRVEVVIRGRPAPTAIPDFQEIVATHPGVTFSGPYDRRMDLESIYADVHFAWTMDFFESGANSDWLLPNRLYEGGFFGAVALAFAPVETGRWLRSRGAGVLVEEPLDRNLADYFGGLDADGYRSSSAAVERIPLSALVDGKPECEALVETLGPPGG